MGCSRCQTSHRFYTLSLQVNGRKISQVEICPYYEKHGDVDDTTVLALVTQLNGQFLEPDGRNDRWDYFATEMLHSEKRYRLVWLLEDETVYIGIVNCFRRD